MLEYYNNVILKIHYENIYLALLTYNANLMLGLSISDRISTKHKTQITTLFI